MCIYQAVSSHLNVHAHAHAHAHDMFVAQEQRTKTLVCLACVQCKLFTKVLEIIYLNHMKI